MMVTREEIETAYNAGLEAVIALTPKVQEENAAQIKRVDSLEKRRLIRACGNDAGQQGESCG